MAAIMLVHTSIITTKTLRDAEEASRYRLEDARTMRFLMDVNRADQT